MADKTREREGNRGAVLKPVPSDPAAEEAVLGSLLVDRDAIIRVASFLAPDDFYVERNRQVYGAILDLYNRRVPADAVTLTAELVRLGHMAAEAAVEFLARVANNTPTWVHIEYYARLVERASTLRRLISVGGEIAALGFSEPEEAKEAIIKATRLITDLAGRTSRGGYVAMDAAMQEFADEWEVLRANPDLPVGVATGYQDLDEMTGGLQKSDVITLAARPSFGKSALAHNIALNAASGRNKHRTRYNVGIFSFEMPRKQYERRLISTMSGVDSEKLRLPRYITEQEEAAVQAAIAELAELPIYIDDTPDRDILSIRTEAHRIAAEHGLDLLIIDYIQLIYGDQKGRTRENVVSEISRGIKLLARELDIPVISLAQLNRESERRDKHVPLLSDLRESGAIEQDSDVVAFLHWPWKYDQTAPKNLREIFIAKQRNGPLGKIPLLFEGETTCFRNCAPAYPIVSAPAAGQGHRDRSNDYATTDYNAEVEAGGDYDYAEERN